MNQHQSQRDWVLAALGQFEGGLVRYATRLLGDEHAARDAVQHTFLRLCRASREEVGERLAAWLYTVCRHRVVDYLRLAGRESSLGDSNDEDHYRGARGEPERDGDPAAVVEKSELRARIRHAVDELPASQREAVWLYAEGMPYREIAVITQRTEGSVRVVVHRAIARLRLHPDLQYLLIDCEPSPAVLQPVASPQRVP